MRIYMHICILNYTIIFIYEFGTYEHIYISYIYIYYQKRAVDWEKKQGDIPLAYSYFKWLCYGKENRKPEQTEWRQKWDRNAKKELRVVFLQNKVSREWKRSWPTGDAGSFR